MILNFALVPMPPVYLIPFMGGPLNGKQSQSREVGCEGCRYIKDMWHMDTSEWKKHAYFLCAGMWLYGGVVDA